MTETVGHYSVTAEELEWVRTYLHASSAGWSMTEEQDDDPAVEDTAGDVWLRIVAPDGVVAGLSRHEHGRYIVWFANGDPGDICRSFEGAAAAINLRWLRDELGRTKDEMLALRAERARERAERLIRALGAEPVWLTPDRAD